MEGRRGNGLRIPADWHPETIFRHLHAAGHETAQQRRPLRDRDERLREGRWRVALGLVDDEPGTVHREGDGQWHVMQRRSHSGPEVSTRLARFTI